MSNTESIPVSSPENTRRPLSHRYLWFLGLGVLSIGGAIYAALFVDPRYEIFAHIAADLGVTLGAIALIDFLWQKLGGSPVEQQVSDFSAATDNALHELGATTAALREFQQTGIAHLEGQISSFSETTNEALN